MLLLFIFMTNALRFLSDNLLSYQHAEDAEKPHFQLLISLRFFFF